MASRSASKIACMSSARPITPSSATDLCGRDDQLHAGPQAVHQPLGALWVACAANTEDRPPLLDANFSIETERGGAGPAPQNGRFSPGGVVLERVGYWVVTAFEDGVLVVADRLGAHHAHPSQAGTTFPKIDFTYDVTTGGCNRVLLSVFYICIAERCEEVFGDR